MTSGNIPVCVAIAKSFRKISELQVVSPRHIRCYNCCFVSDFILSILAGLCVFVRSRADLALEIVAAPASRRPQTEAITPNARDSPFPAIRYGSRRRSVGILATHTARARDDAEHFSHERLRKVYTATILSTVDFLILPKLLVSC
jgi:hypothetical protein